MPPETHTQPRQIRIPDGDWHDFEAAAIEAGTTSSALVQNFIRWYLHRPGARMPKRPTSAPRDPRAESSTHPDVPAADTAPHEP